MADLADDVGSWGQSGLTADIAETTRMTQSGRRKRVAFVSERDSLASRCEA